MEVITVCYENCAEYFNTILGENSEFLLCQTGGTYSWLLCGYSVDGLNFVRRAHADLKA
jgi:hypothetical protein